MSTSTFASFVGPLKGGSYFGAHDPSITAALAPLRQTWSDKFDLTGALASKKTDRDKTSDLHVTILTPAESRKVDRSRVTSLFSKAFTFEAVGVGRIQDGDNEAWFIVLHSPEIQAARKELGFEPKDLHATLGFKFKDIFTVPKTEDTIIQDWSTQ